MKKAEIEIEEVSAEKVKQRRGLNNFWGKFKDGIIDLFKEEEDRTSVNQPPKSSPVGGDF